MANPEWDNYDPYPKMKGELIYLAVPYTHPDQAVVLDRVRRVDAVAAKLMAQGKFVFSPISHTHPIAMAGKLPTGWDYWKRYDEIMISRATALYVLILDGWRESKGVTGEIEIAEKFGVPVTLIDEDLNVGMDACITAISEALADEIDNEILKELLDKSEHKKIVDDL